MATFNSITARNLATKTCLFCKTVGEVNTVIKNNATIGCLEAVVAVPSLKASNIIKSLKGRGFKTSVFNGTDLSLSNDALLAIDNLGEVSEIVINF